MRSARLYTENTQNKVPTGGCNLVMTSRLEGKEEGSCRNAEINFMSSKDSAVKNHIKQGICRQGRASAAMSAWWNYIKTPQYKVALDQLQYGSEGRWHRRIRR